MVLGFLAGLVGEAATSIMSFLTTASIYVSTAFKGVYDILTFVLSSLGRYVGFITSTFPFDNSKKTLMLAVVFFFAIVAMIIIFSGVDITKSGVQTVQAQSINVMSFGENSGASGGGGPGESTSTTMPPTSGGGEFSCVSDEQCDAEATGQDAGTFCCFPDKYEGYSCAGRCLRYSSLVRDACKHPGACIRNKDTFEEVVKDPNVCTNKVGYDIGGTIVPTPNKYCQVKSSQSNTYDAKSTCCTSIGDVCYGYCTTGGSYSCADITACQEENALTVRLVEGGTG